MPKKEKALEGLEEESRGEAEAVLKAWGALGHNSSHTLLSHTRVRATHQEHRVTARVKAPSGSPFIVKMKKVT